MQLINAPHKNIFLDLVKNSQHNIKLCSPFVKKQIVSEVLSNMSDGVALSLITNINLQSFYRNASDISALEMVCENRGIIYNFQRLHAKIFIFDDKYSVITSANLTPSGMGRNYEYGIFINENELVKQICTDYHTICYDEDVAKIGDKQIVAIKKILSELPKSETIRLPRLDLDKDEASDAAIDKMLIESSVHFSGWQRTLFEQLSEQSFQTFSKSDYLRLIPKLQEKYPTNNNIEAKIRQVLQQLRDVGLIKFEGNGVYTKLWK